MVQNCLLAFKTNAHVSRSERYSRRAEVLIALLSTGASRINNMKVPCNSFNVGCREKCLFRHFTLKRGRKKKTHLISKTVTEIKQLKYLDCHHELLDTHNLCTSLNSRT